MGRALKYTFGIIVSLIAILMIATIATLFLVDINSYKGQIVNFIEDKTGYHVEINGDMKLKIFPYLGLALKEVQIKNPEGFKGPYLASVDEAAFSLELMPLLQKDLRFDSVSLNKLTLNLEKNKSGRKNWESQEIQARSGSAKELTAGADASSFNKQTLLLTSGENKQQALQFQIASISLKNSEALFNDYQKNEFYVVEKINLNSKGIKSGQASPIKGGFVFTQQDANKKIILKSQTKLDAILAYQKDVLTLTSADINATLSGSSIAKSAVNADIKSNITANLSSKKIEANDLILTIDNTTASGTMNVDYAKGTKINFDLNAEYLDISPFLAQSNPAPQTVATTEPATYSPVQPPEVIHVANRASGPIVHGKLSINKLKADKVTLSNINTTIKGQGKRFTFQPLSTQVFGGSYQGSGFIDLAGAKPTIGLKGKANQLNMAQVVKFATGENKLTGSGNYDLNIEMRPKGLNGVTKMYIDGGVMNGVDMDYYLDYANAQMKQIAPTKKDRGYTDYKQIRGSFYANDNFLTTNDLYIDADDFYGNAKGHVNLNNQTLDLNIVINRKHHDGKKHPNALPLAVNIKGPIGKPTITPDYDAYIKAMIEKEAKKALENEAAKLIGGDGEQGVEEVIEEKIEKELEKGIKKLFKF